MFLEVKTPYTHFNKDIKFPVDVIFTGNTCYRFTQGKVYHLSVDSNKQYTNCSVIDDHGTELSFTKSGCWKPLYEIRDEKLEKLFSSN